MNKWFLWKLQRRLDWISFKESVAKFFYCNRGYHRFGGRCESTMNHKKETITSTYIICNTCETCFFPTTQDKINYLRIKDQHKDQVKRMLEQMIKAPIKVKGKSKVREFK